MLIAINAKVNAAITIEFAEIIVKTISMTLKVKMMMTMKMNAKLVEIIIS